MVSCWTFWCKTGGTAQSRSVSSPSASSTSPAQVPYRLNITCESHSPVIAPTDTKVSATPMRAHWQSGLDDIRRAVADPHAPMTFIAKRTDRDAPVHDSLRSSSRAHCRVGRYYSADSGACGKADRRDGTRNVQGAVSLPRPERSGPGLRGGAREGPGARRQCRCAHSSQRPALPSRPQGARHPAAARPTSSNCCRSGSASGLLSERPATGSHCRRRPANAIALAIRPGPLQAARRSYIRGQPGPPDQPTGKTQIRS